MSQFLKITTQADWAGAKEQVFLLNPAHITHVWLTAGDAVYVSLANMDSSLRVVDRASIDALLALAGERPVSAVAADDELCDANGVPF